MHTNIDNGSSLPRVVLAIPTFAGLALIASLLLPTPIHPAGANDNGGAPPVLRFDPPRNLWVDPDMVRLLTLEPVATEIPVLLAAAPVPVAWETIDPPRTREAAGELFAAFTARGYTVASLREDADPIAPRVRVMRLPDLTGLVAATDRRALFIKALLPLILEENARIEADRDRLAAIMVRATQDISEDDMEFVRALAARYDLRPEDLDELVRRNDIIPVSLALAQAAMESGWGTSYGARIMQALFGQMAGTRLRAFPDLPSAVQAYVMNLNRHRAYTRFRAARAQMRERGAEIDVLELTGQLTGYSELGEAYTRYIRGLIRENDLQRFDRVRLAG